MVEDDGTDAGVAPSIPGHKRRRSDTDSETWEAITAAMGKMNTRRTTNRSREQKEAVAFTLDETYNGIIVLPTTGGKSLIFQLAALMSGQRMVILVIPFRALLDATLADAHRQGINAIEWEQEVPRFHPLVLVSAEVAVKKDFIGYEQRAREADQLAMLIFDEAHVLVKDR